MDVRCACGAVHDGNRMTSSGVRALPRESEGVPFMRMATCTASTCESGVCGADVCIALWHEPFVTYCWMPGCARPIAGTFDDPISIITGMGPTCWGCLVDAEICSPPSFAARPHPKSLPHRPYAGPSSRERRIVRESMAQLGGKRLQGSGDFRP